MQMEKKLHILKVSLLLTIGTAKQTYINSKEREDQDLVIVM